MDSKLRQSRQVGSIAKEEPKPVAVQVAGVATVLPQIVWVVVVLGWPILKRIVALDCVYQFVRMLYFWGASGGHGLIFLVHFAVFTALTCYVSLYKPKGM